MLFKSETIRRRITLVAGLVFALGMGQSLISVFMASNSASDNAAQAVDNTETTQVDLIKGYEIVLDREPNNQTALKGLVDVHLSRGQLQEMIPPLEKLIALNPNDESYSNLLATITAELTQQTPSSKTEPTP